METIKEKWISMKALEFVIPIQHNGWMLSEFVMYVCLIFTMIVQPDTGHTVFFIIFVFLFPLSEFIFSSLNFRFLYVRYQSNTLQIYFEHFRQIFSPTGYSIKFCDLSLAVLTCGRTILVGKFSLFSINLQM